MSKTRVVPVTLLLVAAACSTSESPIAPLQPTVNTAVAQAQPLRVPRPKLVLDSLTPFYGANYDLTVSNWSKFPDEMFVASPNLPACGLNTSASRSYVEIYDSNGTLLNSFCALYGASSLADIWVYAPQLPVSVYVVIWDRLTDKRYKSNTVTIPAPAP